MCNWTISVPTEKGEAMRLIDADELLRQETERLEVLKVSQCDEWRQGQFVRCPFCGAIMDGGNEDG